MAEQVAPVLHLSGWAGTGKLTIARIIAAQTGARVLDNHAMMAAAQALYDRGHPRFAPFRDALRGPILEEAATLTPSVSLIVTDAFAERSDERRWFDEIRTLAKKRRARFIAAQLLIDEAENLRRLTASGRAERGKLINPEILKDLRAQHTLLEPRADLVIRLDVTKLSAEAAAATLITHL